jgi:type I restriction enzyme S subunit
MKSNQSDTSKPKKINTSTNIISFGQLLEEKNSLSVGVMYPGEKVLTGIPLIKVGDVNNVETGNLPDAFISQDVHSIYKRTEIQGNELIITLVGSPGYCFLAKAHMKGWNVARALAVAKLKEPAEATFVKYALNSPDVQAIIKTRLNTTVQATLNLKDLKEIILPWPDKSSRKKISQILESIDEKIITNSKINARLEQLAQTIFKSWFVDFDPVHAKKNAIEAGLAKGQAERAAMSVISGLCSPSDYVENKEMIERNLEEKLVSIGKEKAEELKMTASLFPSDFEDSVLGEIPTGWKVSMIADLLSIKHGYAFKGEFFKDEPTKNILVTPGNFKIGGGFKSDKFKYYDGPIDESYILKPFDLIVTMTDLSKIGDTLGYPALIPKDSALTFLHNQRVGKIIFKDNVQKLKNYFYILFMNDRYRHEVLSSMTGSTVKHTSPNRIEAFKFPYSNQLSLQYSNLIDSMIGQLNQNDIQSKTLECLRDTLLPKLLAGEINLDNLKLEGDS